MYTVTIVQHPYDDDLWYILADGELIRTTRCRDVIGPVLHAKTYINRSIRNELYAQQRAYAAEHTVHRAQRN